MTLFLCNDQSPVRYQVFHQDSPIRGPGLQRPRLEDVSKGPEEERRNAQMEVLALVG